MLSLALRAELFSRSPSPLTREAVMKSYMRALESRRFLIRRQLPGVGLAEWRRGFVIVRVDNKLTKLNTNLKYIKYGARMENPSLKGGGKIGLCEE